MTLRICHIISGDLWAGAEVMSFTLLEGLSRRTGIEPFAIVLNEGMLSQHLENSGIEVFVIDENRYSFRQIIRKAGKIIRQLDPAVIHSHRYKENLLACLVSLIPGRDIVLFSTQHGMPEHGYQDPASAAARLKTFVNFKLMSSMFDMTVAVSADIGNALQTCYGFKTGRTAIIHNGIPVRNGIQRTSSGACFTVGSAGRLVAVKNYNLLIEIARELASRVKDIQFELAGTGPEQGQLRNLVAKYGLQNNFRFRGHLDDIGAFYRSLDVYVNTSLHEGIPMSVLEAMSTGLPVVVPKVGGMSEVIADTVDGFLVDSQQPGDYVTRILALHESEELRESIGQAARAKVIREFSQERMVSSYISLYSGIADRTARSLNRKGLFERWSGK